MHGSLYATRSGRTTHATVQRPVIVSTVTNCGWEHHWRLKPPDARVVYTALPLQQCSGLDPRTKGWTFSTFCFVMNRRCLGTFVGSQRRLLSVRLRRTVSVRTFQYEKKTTASNSSVLEHPAGCSSTVGLYGLCPCRRASSGRSRRETTWTL